MSAGGDDTRDEAAPPTVLPDAGVPPIDFNTFVISLSTSALVHLGAVAGPDGKPGPIQLPLARQTIDILGLLEQKTAGNLTGEEERLLHQVVYDLKMRYLAVCDGRG